MARASMGELAPFSNKTCTVCAGETPEDDSIRMAVDSRSFVSRHRFCSWACAAQYTAAVRDLEGRGRLGDADAQFVAEAFAPQKEAPDAEG